MGKRRNETVNEAIVIAVIEGGMSTKEAAQRFNLSQRWVRTLVRRATQNGINAVKPKSTKPKTNPNRTNEHTRQRILFLKDELTRAGLDAGPESIWDRLDQPRPHPTTIYRILRAAGKVQPCPKKRPKRSYIRFEASRPNEMWQSDFTHWHTKDHDQVEIITWLDDHSRFALNITACQRVTAHTVVQTFTTSAHEHGYPTSTLTDNAMVYTTRLAAGANQQDKENQKNMFEKLLQDLGIKQKNSLPGHPTTQGKIERWHQTLKKWLKTQPPAQTIPELQKQLNQFQTIYNQQRPHRAIGRQTPHTAYNALPKAQPTQELLGQTWRVRHDKVGTNGVITYRWAGQLKHLGIGREHKNKQIIILAQANQTITIDRATGEIIAEHTINPNKNYQPKTHHTGERCPAT